MYVLIIIFVVIYVQNGLADDYIINQLNESGIMFEKVTPTILYSDIWEIYTTVTLDDATERIEYIEYCAAQMDQICKKINYTFIEGICSHMITDIKGNVNKIKINEAELKHGFRARRKRGLLNIGGQGFKFLFGTMDNTDAEDIYQRLRKLEQNDQINFDLIKEQVSVVKANYHRLEKPITGILKEVEAFNSKIEEIRDILNDINRHNQLQQELAEISSYILLHLLELQRVQGTALSILNSLRMHMLHPLILGHNELNNILKNITNTINLHKEFHNLHHLEQIVQIEYYESHQGLIIKIEVPLPTTGIYTTNKIYYLPIHIRNGTHLRIKEKEDYILSDYGKKEYLFMDQLHRNKCKEVIINFKQRLNICQSTQPILKTDDHCLIKLLNNPFEEEVPCTYEKISHDTDSFTQLVAANAWLYVIEDFQLILINCNDNETTVRLTGQGVIVFYVNCQIKTPDYYLPVKGTTTSTVVITQPLNYLPNFTNWKHKIPEKERGLIWKANTKTHIELNAAQPEIENWESHVKLAEIIRKTKTASSQQGNDKMIVITLGIFIIILVVIVVFLRYRKNCMRRKLPAVQADKRNSTTGTGELQLESIQTVNQELQSQSTYVTARPLND